MEVLDKYKVEESKKRSFFKGVEALPWTGEEYARTREQEVRNKRVERRLLGSILFSLFRKESIRFVALAKQAGGVNRRRGDEAAAKDGYHERSD